MNNDTPIRMDFPGSTFPKALQPLATAAAILVIICFIGMFVIAAIQTWFEKRESKTGQTAPSKSRWALIYGLDIALGLACLALVGWQVKSTPHAKSSDVVDAIETHYDVTYRDSDQSKANPYQVGAGDGGSDTYAVSGRYELETRDHRILKNCETYNQSSKQASIEITVSCDSKPLHRVR